MARITPATNAAIFTDDILDLLPANKDLKRGVAMQKRSEDPEWRAKNKLANQLKAQDPEWLANNKLAIEKRSDNLEWQANQKLAGEKRAADPEWLANNKLRGEKLAQDPEWRANHKLAMEKLAADPEWLANLKLAGEKRAKPVIGIHIETGEIIMLCGNREMEAAGFDPAGISNCIAGRKKHHKKYIWSRDEPN